MRKTSNPLNSQYVGDRERTLYIDEKPVTSIDLSLATEIKPTAFYGYEALESVTIGNSVTVIGDSAFYHCGSLQTVSFNNATKLKTIEFGAFRACDALQSITIPSSVETIAPYAFYACDNLRTVKVGDGVTDIGYRAFQQCKALSSLTLGSSLEKIEESAFSFCESLTTVRIPASVNFIGQYAFDYSGLRTAYFESPTGWKFNRGVGTVNYVDIEGLDDPNTAAEHLIVDYVGKHWEKQI